jgi:pantetheine-phosphate adenylyltransferase
MHKALCPGSFDPPTLGHMDVIERAARLFDEVLVAVVVNPGKDALFSLEERTAMLEELTRDLPNVKVASFSGLLVDFAKSEGADCVVKGLRAVSDFDYELQQAQMNQRLTGVDTLFMPTRPAYSFLSSSLIRQVAGLGGSVAGQVPPLVEAALRERYS